MISAASSLSLLPGTVWGSQPLAWRRLRKDFNFKGVISNFKGGISNFKGGISKHRLMGVGYFLHLRASSLQCPPGARDVFLCGPSRVLWVTPVP